MEVLGVWIPEEDLELSALITFKANLIVLASIALLSTTSIFSLVHALRHLRFPDKFVQIFFFCFRYLHVMERELLKLLQAMKVRGFQPKNDLHTYRSYGYLVGSLLKAFDRSERVYKAMICRGFEGKFWMLDHFRMKRGRLSGPFLDAFWCALIGVYQWF